MSDQNWIRPEDLMPTKGDRVRWLNSAGSVVHGTFAGVWLMDNGMYIYYQPTFWQPDV